MVRVNMLRHRDSTIMLSDGRRIHAIITVRRSAYLKWLAVRLTNGEQHTYWRRFLSA